MSRTVVFLCLVFATVSYVIVPVRFAGAVTYEAVLLHPQGFKVSNAYAVSSVGQVSAGRPNDGDLHALLSGTTRSQGDFNEDGQVDLTDIGILKQNSGSGPVFTREPPALLMAVFGLATLAGAALRRQHASRGAVQP